MQTDIRSSESGAPCQSRLQYYIPVARDDESMKHEKQVDQICVCSILALGAPLGNGWADHGRIER